MKLLWLPGICLFCLSGWPFTELSAAISEDDSKDTLLLVWVYRDTKPRDCSIYFLNGCIITGDRSLYSRADAVILRHREVISSSDAPLPVEPRPPGQKWIWFNMESPTNVQKLWEYEGIYNLTLTYREDSDISLSFGYLVPNVLLDIFPQTSSVHSLEASSDARPGLVSWVVSHWDDTLERVSFYKVFKEYITVDIFGRAGKPIPPGLDSVVDLIRQYRFYLAFENAQHTDYITEKLWNAVRGGAIPVVLGPPRRNYERFLPPEAFIHVDDFSTPQELAQYLLKVKDSPALTEMHLRWREHYSFYKTSLWGEFYCMACGIVKVRKGRTDMAKNISSWFFS